MVTGAATSWLLVKQAAALAGVSQTASATSGLPLALMPALVEDQRKPRGRVELDAFIEVKSINRYEENRQRQRL